MANRHHKRSNDRNNPSSREVPLAFCQRTWAGITNSFIGSVYHQIAGYCPACRLVGMCPQPAAEVISTEWKRVKRLGGGTEYITLPETFRTVGTLQNGHERYEDRAHPGTPAPRSAAHKGVFARTPPHNAPSPCSPPHLHEVCLKSFPAPRRL